MRFGNVLFTAAHSKRFETHTLEAFVVDPHLSDVKYTALVFTAGCKGTFKPSYLVITYPKLVAYW